MGNHLAKAIAVAQRAASRVCGGTIVYQRGSDQVELPDATFGRSEFAAETSQGLTVEHTDRDFVFCWRLLVLGGQVATPARGDRIETDDGSVYEVLPIDGEKCHRTAGPDSSGRDVLIRVHTKKRL